METDNHSYSTFDVQQELNKLITFVNNNRVQRPVPKEVLKQAQLPPPAKFQRKNRSLLAAQTEPPRGPIENEEYIEPSSEIEFSDDTSSLGNEVHLQMSSAVAADDYDSVLLILMDVTPLRDV